MADILEFWAVNTFSEAFYLWIIYFLLSCVFLSNALFLSHSQNIHRKNLAAVNILLEQEKNPEIYKVSK